MGRTRWIGACVVVSLVTACGDDEPETKATDQAVTSSNGAWQNGLTSNALFSNGAWQNGAWQNGVLQNGAWQNGAWQNGAWQNGAWQNGAWQNGAWQNGAWQNGAWQNGAWQNGADGTQTQVTEWRNGTWTGELWTSEFWQAEARHDLLRDNPYTAKVLQYIYSCAMPSTSHKTIDAGGGISVRLDGGIGLAPTWDSATGACDETCQRWVSACVLARTNAYGEVVDISMRVPTNAPEYIQTALAVTPAEAAEYTEREGTFFGNIFATTPADSTGERFTNTPHLMACAGPFSNLPDLTRRFVSSQGDSGPIAVLGTCEEHPNHPAVCAGLDSTGVETACFGPPMRSDGTPSEYDEVITVYLKKPITKCGNSVCENGELADVCPSDCHPGTSAVNLGIGLFGSSVIAWGAQNAAPTPDGNVLVGGVVYGPIDLGVGATDGSGWNFVLAKYTRAGHLLWTRAYSHYNGADLIGLGGFSTFTIAVAADGAIAIAAPTFGYQSTVVWRLAPDGTVATGWPVQIAAGAPQGPATFDASGNLYVTSGGTSASRIRPDGTIDWTVAVGPGDPHGLALDGRGGLFVSYAGNVGGMAKLDAETGAQIWSLAGEFHALAADANGDVFVAYDRFHAFLLKLSGLDGHELARAEGTRVCDPQSPPWSPCSSGILSGINIVLDRDGNVIMASSGGGGPRGFDFGAGEFRPYGSYDSYLSAYRTSDLKFRWAKHVPFILDGGQNSFTVDSNGALTMIGAFSGSMLWDDRLLVNSIPEIGGHSEIFVGSMNQPPADDTTPPVMSDLPGHIVVQATSAAGAQVWYATPTALDSGNAGVNVVCSPASNTFFAIGDTTVECVAYDPLGNQTGTQSFVITVEDNTGPIFAAKAIAPTIEETSSGDMVLRYDQPLAFDELAEQFVTVTCTPPSGSTFATNEPISVTCSALDFNNNSSSIGFLVTVTQDPALGTGAASYSAVVTSAIVPKIAITGPGFVEATGPDGAPVTFTVETSDDQGIVSTTCTKTSGDIFSLGETFVTCTTKNVAGFTNADTYRVVVQDTTAPTLTIDAPTDPVPATDGGAIVHYDTAATDRVTAEPTITCDPPSGSRFLAGTTLVECRASDDAGNETARTFTVTVDAPPTLTVPTTPVTGTYGDPITYSVSASDDAPGVTYSCDPPSGSMLAPGTTTVTCTATDSAGQTTTRSFDVQVTVPWSGFLQPINMDNTSIFKQGSTIPVKFKLTGAAAAVTNLVATIRVQKVANNVTGSELEVISSGAADSGTTFRYDPTGGLYIFNLSTTNLTAGTYAISANLGDGIWHSVNVSIRK